ncbi:unnamed protein product, partial [marine sediment metagenome]
MVKKIKKNQIIFAATILITMIVFLINLSLISCKNIEKNTYEIDKYTELRNNMVDYQIT